MNCYRFRIVVTHASSFLKQHISSSFSLTSISCFFLFIFEEHCTPFIRVVKPFFLLLCLEGEKKSGLFIISVVIFLHRYWFANTLVFDEQNQSPRPKPLKSVMGGSEAESERITWKETDFISGAALLRLKLNYAVLDVIFHCSRKECKYEIGPFNGRFAAC